MRFAFRICALLIACFAVAGGQVVQTDHFVVNAGLTKALDAVGPSAVAFSRDGAVMGAIDKDGALSLYKGDGSSIARTDTHSPGKAAIAFSPYGDVLATWGADQKVALWATKDLAAVRTVASGVGKPSCLAFSGDGTRLACGGDDGSVKVLSISNGATLASSKLHKRAILALAFEPSGKTIVSVGGDREMVTCDAASGQVVRSKFLPVKVKFDAKPEDEFQEAHSASCTPDGSIFAVGGYSFYRQLGGMGISFETVVLFDRTGRRLVAIGDKTMLKLSENVSIAPDGKLLATAAPNGMMRIWDVEHNQLCGQIIGQGAIKQTASAKYGNNYVFAVAGKAAAYVAISPTEPQPQIPGEQPSGSNEGLSIEFASPGEIAPIVNSPTIEVSAIVNGVKAAPRYTVQIAGTPTAPVTLQPSENRDLVLAPAPASPGAAAPAAVKIGAAAVRIAENVTLSEGPNRVKVTVQDGSRQVSAVKTICYVPDGDTLDKAKIYSSTYAVVIGVNKYGGKNSKNIPALTGAVADADAVAETLKKDFGVTNLLELTDASATHDKVMAALNALTDSQQVKPNDRVIVFWSGHGQTVTAPEGGQIGYLLPSDAQVDLTNLDNVRPYRDTCVPMDEIAKLAREIPAKHVLFLVDACFSGLAATNGSAMPANTFGLLHQAYFDAKQIITASSQFEPAKEKGGHGYFTTALLEALKDPAADENKDGYLTASELFRYIQPKVQAMNTNQSPRLARFSLGIGETLFFK